MKEETTPIILANTDWMPPEKLLNEVRAERMISALCDFAKPKALDYKDLVGDAECLAYLMPATMRAPLNSYWVNIYLYLAGRVLKRWGTYAAAPDDIKVEKISDYEERMLDDLRFKIYESRGRKLKNPIINALKEVFK